MTCSISAIACCCSSDSRSLRQQPRILDRDDRLIGECPDKFDLPVSKWFDPLPREQDDADRFAFPQQRHA